MLPQRQSFSFGAHVSSRKVLEKKIPENPRYKHVHPVVDSGNTLKKHINSLRESQRNNLYRMDEVFHRIKLSSFVKLVIEVSRIIPDHEPQGVVSSEVTGEKQDEEDKIEKPIPLTPFQSVLVGIGELDLQNKARNPPQEQPDHNITPFSPYLLLDVRCPDDYRQYRIITARNYPYTMLCRSPGYETKDLLQYKNVPEKLIILCDEEENIAPRVASTLVQRGYDNIYVLTGGIKLACEKFPYGLISGNVAQPVLKSQRSHEMAASHETDEYVHRDEFTKDDIAKLQQQMDTYFPPEEVTHTSASKGCKPKTQERQSVKRVLHSGSKNRPWK